LGHVTAPFRSPRRSSLSPPAATADPGAAGEELLAAAQTADELGYYACYSADEIYHKDAWLLLGSAAARTERIRLGPCVASVYLRDPSSIAQLVATLDELSGGCGELVLGIILEQYGIEWRGTRPIARLREAHRVVRTLLDGRTSRSQASRIWSNKYASSGSRSCPDTLSRGALTLRVQVTRTHHRSLLALRSCP
jgi:alkanesulfonate monooxygenase SsuD/methylene tetrahydromethanopterin reductase-like flavin-dependent oxidoreductase (luciferase family)